MTSSSQLLTPPNGIDERTYWADRIWRPWIETVVPLRGATVLEFGCGPGSVSQALAPHAKRYIGLDIDATAVAAAHQSITLAGRRTAEFHAHPAEEIVEALAQYAGMVDVLLLYAVVEHLTLEERQATLRVARRVVHPGGVIVVVELPNRLSSLDWHSSWLPFITQLPDELALDYVEQAERPELRSEVLARRNRGVPAAEDADALLALRRFGRGASFHEFELAWEDSVAGYALACNWEPEVIPHREFDPGELALARTMARLHPELDPSWSRQWIDVILSPQLPVRRRPFHRPWVGAPGPASQLVSHDYVTDVLLVASEDARLHVELPEATDQVALRLVSGCERLTVNIETVLGERVGSEVASRPGQPVTVVLDLPDWSDDLLIRMSGGAWLLGMTYRGYGPGRLRTRLTQSDHSETVGDVARYRQSAWPRDAEAAN